MSRLIVMAATLLGESWFSAFSRPYQVRGIFFDFPTILQSTSGIKFFNAQVREAPT